MRLWNFISSLLRQRFCWCSYRFIGHSCLSFTLRELFCITNTNPSGLTNEDSITRFCWENLLYITQAWAALVHWKENLSLVFKFVFLVTLIIDSYLWFSNNFFCKDVYVKWRKVILLSTYLTLPCKFCPFCKDIVD